MRRLPPSCLLAALFRLLAAPVLAAPTLAAAQAPVPALSRADSVLVYEILSAEDRRDAAAPALARGEAHADARIAHIARRARARLGDSTFAARSVLGQPDDARPFPSWPEPEWAARYRALGGREGGCAPLLAALADSAVQVRQRAVILSGQRRECVANPALRDHLLRFIEEGRGESPSRARGEASWPLASDALVALSRVEPDASSGARIAFRRNPHPMLRRAAARSAAIVRDTSTLRLLMRDQDGNVQEAALRGLATLTGLAFESDFRRLLGREVPQAALAAAEALKGTTDPETKRAAADELARRVARNWASERDIRNALRAVIGEAPTEAWQPGRPDSLPWDAVALALGERRFVRVTMSRLHGGRDFTVELRGDVAPIQAARVLAHVRANAYDGTRWHRVEPNFVIQGGSPHDNEYSGSGRFVVDELSTVPHPRGSVGMSTRGHSTGDLQWFVNLRDNARLTADYTVFGVIVDGMDAVDDVMEGDQISVMREVSGPRPARP